LLHLRSRRGQTGVRFDFFCAILTISIVKTNPPVKFSKPSRSSFKKSLSLVFDANPWKSSGRAESYECKSGEIGALARGLLYSFSARENDEPPEQTAFPQGPCSSPRVARFRDPRLIPREPWAFPPKRNRSPSNLLSPNIPSASGHRIPPSPGRDCSFYGKGLNLLLLVIVLVRFFLLLLLLLLLLHYGAG
jgi:hypothetical protein